MSREKCASETNGVAKANEQMSEWCKRIRERTSKWPSTLCVDFIVIPPIVTSMKTNQNVISNAFIDDPMFHSHAVWNQREEIEWPRETWANGKVTVPIMITQRIKNTAIIAIAFLQPQFANCVCKK